MIDSAWKSWYKAKHDQRCQASGEAFEIYVTELLSRFHSDFVNPSPMGSYGDGGCDGLADSGAIFYACYGQRATTGIDQKQNRNSNLTSRARLNVGMTSRIGGLLPMRPLVPHR